MLGTLLGKSQVQALDLEVGWAFIRLIRDSHVHVLVSDEGIGRDTLGQENAGANGRAGPHDGFAAHDGGIGVNRDVTFDGGMALLAPQLLAASQGTGRLFR